jgi:hypothetical protein
MKLPITNAAAAWPAFIISAAIFVAIFYYGVATQPYGGKTWNYIEGNVVTREKIVEACRRYDVDEAYALKWTLIAIGSGISSGIILFTLFKQIKEEV